MCGTKGGSQVKATKKMATGHRGGKPEEWRLEGEQFEEEE